MSTEPGGQESGRRDYNVTTTPAHSTPEEVPSRIMLRAAFLYAVYYGSYS